jgi:thymidylate synthase
MTNLIHAPKEFTARRHPMSAALEQPYLDYLRYIYTRGRDKMDRTGTGTRSAFGYMMRFDLFGGYIPRLTTKFVPAKTVFDELKWFLEGSTSNHRLREINQAHSKLDWSEKDTIWEEWADPKTGGIGPGYGFQWRHWPGEIQQRIVGTQDWTPLSFNEDGSAYAYTGAAVRVVQVDQISEVLDILRKSPDSRRIVVNAWNPGYISKMALPPCHMMFQFYTVELTFQERLSLIDDPVAFFPARATSMEEKLEVMDTIGIPKRRLDCMLYQRSADSFLGVPFNILSYSLLVHMMAHQLDMAAGEFVWVGGDCHIYNDHFTQVEEILSRTPSRLTPRLKFTDKPASLFEYEWPHLEIVDYEHQGEIKAPVSK